MAVLMILPNLAISAFIIAASCSGVEMTGFISLRSKPHAHDTGLHSSPCSGQDLLKSDRLLVRKVITQP